MIEIEINQQPLPKRRPRVVNGHAYTPPETVVWEHTVGFFALRAMADAGIDPYDTPVAVTLYFRRKGKRDVDADNLAKAVTDAMNGIVYVDDRQIVELHVYKQIECKNPGVLIQIAPATAPGGDEE